MAFSQETFPSDLILPGLVDWFNNQSLATRTIATTDVALFKVKVIVDEAGTAQMIIGDAPYANANATFLCEATFVWKGARGADLQATTASFFEVSKFVPQKASGGAINIIPFVGTVTVEEDVSVQILNRVMAYGFASMWAGETTVGLTGIGQPEERSTTNYLTQINFPAGGFKKVSSGDGWFAALHEDGSVYGWGHNSGLLNGYVNTPTKIDMANFGSSAIVKDIAAIGKALYVINGDDVAFTIGDTGYTINPGSTNTNMKSIDSLHVWNEYNNTIEQVYVYGLDNSGQVLRSGLDVNGNTLDTIVNAPSLNGNARQIAINNKFGAVVYNDDSMVLWGDSNAISGLPYMDAYYATAVDSVHMMNQGGIVILYKTGQLRYWLPTTQQWFTMSSAKAVSAGYKHFVALFNEGNVDCRGDGTYGQTAYPSFSQPVRQVFAGCRHSVAMMEDGSLVWWGEGDIGGSVGSGSGYAIG